MTIKNQKQLKTRRGDGSAFFRRTLALGLCFVQVFTGSPAYPAEMPKNAPRTSPGIQVELRIPEKLGTLDEFHAARCPDSVQSNCAKTVIYIQDAHDSLEAQKNIAKMIHLLVDNYGVKTVLEEGYEGPVPTDKYFGQIKDPKVRKKVAYFLLDKLRLGGAEYAHITRSDQGVRRDFQLMGADSFLLHRKNIERYQASEKNRAATQEDLLGMDAEIRKMTQRYFSRPLKEGMSLKEKLDRKELDLMDYLKRTQALFVKGIGFEEFRTAYPNLSLLLSAAETKEENLLAKLKASVSYKAIFQEISRLEDDYAETHLSFERDRKIFDYYKQIQLLKRLNHIEVTEEEYEAVKGSLQGMSTAKIADFIAAETGHSLVLSKQWETTIQDALEFYEIARERDGSIQGKLEEYAAGEDPSPVVLVYGGFHKGRVKELLEQSGLSYAVVSPKITAVSPKHQAYYRQLMRMGYDTMAIPRLVATATSPPRLLDFAALSDQNEIRVREQLDFLTQMARTDSSDYLDAFVGALDLELGKRRHAKARSEMRTQTPDPFGDEELWDDIRQFVSAVHPKQGDQAVVIGTGADPMPGIYLAMNGVHVRSVDPSEGGADEEIQQASKAGEFTREAGGRYEILRGHDYLDLKLPESSQKIITATNFFDDPSVDFPERILNKIFYEIQAGGYILASFLYRMPDYNAAWVLKRANESGLDVEEVTNLPYPDTGAALGLFSSKYIILKVIAKRSETENVGGRSADSMETVRSEVRAGIESYRAAMRDALGETPGIETQPLTIEAQIKLAEAYTALLRGLYPPEKGKVFMVFPALSTDLFPGLEFPGLYLNRTTDDYGDGVSILSKLKDMPSSNIMSTLIKNFRFIRVEANPLDLAHYEVLRDREASKIEGRAVFVMKGFRREFESWGKDARFVNQVLKDLKEGDEILILDRDDLAFAVEQGWLSPAEGERLTLFPSQGESGDDNRLELSHGSSQGRKIQLPSAAAVIAVPQGGVMALTNRAGGSTAAVKTPPQSETTLSWNEPWIMLPGQLTRDVSLVDLAEKQRANPSPWVLDSRVQPMADELQRLMSEVHAQLPDAGPVLNDARVHMPSYLTETAHDHQNMINLSGPLRAPVFLPELFQEQILAMLSQSPEKIMRLLESLQGFMVHEYGHIVDANGGLIQTDREGQKEKRSALIQKYGLTKKDRAVIVDVQGDLRAESYRHHFLDRFRASAVYGEDHYDHLQPESIHREWRRDLIYMAAWTIDLEKNGPVNRSRRLAERVQAAKNLSPEQIEFYESFVVYFRGYFESLRYDPDWVLRLEGKGEPHPVVRDKTTGIPLDLSRSEVRGDETAKSELDSLALQYRARRLEILSADKTQDYQKVQEYGQLMREIVQKIYVLAESRFPGVDSTAAVALSGEKVPEFAEGRILKSAAEGASEAAVFIQSAVETVFGKPWEIILVDAEIALPQSGTEDKQMALVAENAREFRGEQWLGGSTELREKRRGQYRSFIYAAGTLKKDYENRRAEIWGDQESPVVEKMRRHSELADMLMRELYGLSEKLYPEQSRGMALIAYGGHGRGEMHLSSDSEGRMLLRQESDALDAAKFLSNATEMVFGSGSRWLVMLAKDAVKMEINPKNPLNVQEGDIIQATELMDARFLAGNREIGDEQIEFFKQQLTERGLDLTKSLIDVWNGRYRQAGFVEGLYEREPDVKEGTGGLRTMHYVRWIAQAYTQKKDGYWEELLRLKLLKKRELERALRAYEFLNRVRGELGHVKQGANDPNRLTLDAQVAVAYALGYKDSALAGAAVDQMFRDYDAQALALFRFSYKVIRRISESENIRPVREVLVDGDLYQGKVKLDARRATRSGYVFQLSRGFRELKDPKTFLVPAVREDGQPQDKISLESMMPLFLYAVENQLKFSGQLLDALEKAAPHFKNKFLADKKFRSESQSYFKSLLAVPHQTAYVLERMYLLGILPVLLPGFKETGYRPRLEMDYRTTLDWYALQSVDALDKFMSGQLSELEGWEISESAKTFFKKISEKPALLRRIRLALLLQKFDDASLRTAMKQLKLNKKTAAAVEWLRAHPDDLNELIRADAFWQSDILPAYVEKEIGQNTELGSFFIGASLARLYALRPEQFWLYLEAVEPAFKLENRLGQPAELSERLAHDHGTVNKLMQLFFGGPREDKKTVVLVEPLSENREGSAKVTVYHRQADDLPGWLERIAGVFAANGLVIESETVGDILGESVIIDRFIVTLLPTQLLPGQKKDFGKIWRDMERQLNENVRDVLERDIPVSRIFENKKGLAPPYVSKLPKTLLNRPTVVSFDEDIRVGNLPQRLAGLTVLRVETADRPMLLYTLTKIIAAHGLNIHAGSTIDTEGYDRRIGRQAVDTFILSDRGARLTSSQQVDLLRDLHFWLNLESIDLAQLDRHRELLIYKRRIETYLAQMKGKTAVRIGYVGDIHGDLDRFNQIVSRLERQGIQKIIFMGDFIDHGSQGKEVMQAVRQWVEQGKAVALMGNHELMFIESILAPGSSYSRRFDLWLSSGGWALLREFLGDSIQGVDISAEGSQKIKFGQEDFFVVMDAAKKNKDLIELARWMKANLKLFHEDENMGFSAHARLKIDEQGSLQLEEEDSGRGVQRSGREILNNMQADWSRGDPGDELRQNLLDYRSPQSTILLGGDLPANLLNVPSHDTALQSLLTSLRSLRVFNGHIEPNESPEEHIDFSRSSSGVFNSIDYGIRKGMGGYVVSSSEGIGYFLLPSSEAENLEQEKPVYEVEASAVIKQAKDMLTAVETAIHANTQSVKAAQNTSARSEVRTVPDDLVGLMPPLDTVTLQPIDASGRETILHLNRSFFAEHFTEGSRNFEALREFLTKNYARRPNQRSLFIDLPDPFVMNGRRWVRLQLKGTVFDSRQPILPHSEEAYKTAGEGQHAKGAVENRLEVFPDGRIQNVGVQPSPDGAMILDKAVREFALSESINQNPSLAAKNLFAPGAVAYGEFPGLFFNGQPLAFVVLGIDDEMAGAVTRLNENSDTVEADVTRALRLLHHENHSHPFLHGGNLSSNVARTKWYVHDLDASRLFDNKTDTLSFVAASQIRDFFYIIEKYVFDRYLSNSHPDAALWGFRNLQAILGAYLLERKRAGALWELETGYLVSGNTVRIYGGIEEVVEHYLQQLESPGNSVVFRDILFPRGRPRPLLAAADLGIEIQSLLRKKGFNDLVRRSEVRGYDEEIFSLAEALVGDSSLAFMPGDEWDVPRVIARHYIQLRSLGQKEESEIRDIFKQALDLLYEQAKAESPVPEEHFDKYWAAVVRQAADRYLDYHIEFEPDLPESMPPEEQQALQTRMLEYASLTDDYTFHGLSQLIEELKDWDRDSATNRMLARPAIQDLDSEAQEILSKRLTIEAAFNVMDLVWGTGSDGHGSEDRTVQERDQLREALSRAKAFAIGPKNAGQRSEVRTKDITYPNEDDALAREYEGMQAFEAESQLQRRTHASSPKAFLLKDRDPAADRKQLESKFRDVVFIRDWIGVQILTLMSNAKGAADWKTLDQPMSVLYPDQAALEGVQLASQAKGDAVVDFLFRVENKKIMLELRNAETHRSLSRTIARNFIRKRFTPAGQSLLGQLAQGKDVNEILQDGARQDGARHPLGGQAEEVRSEVRQTKINSPEPATVASLSFSLKAMIEKAGPTKIFADVSAPVTSAEQTAGELSRLAKAGAQVVIYNLARARSDNELVRILETFPKALFHSVPGSWSDALAGSEHAPDELNLVHYSEKEAESKVQAPAWAEKRVIYLAGKSGSAAYALSQVRVLRKAVEADEIKESLLARLEIEEKKGFYFVSEAKSTWMRLQLEAESIVAFAQAA